MSEKKVKVVTVSEHGPHQIVRNACECECRRVGRSLHVLAIARLVLVSGLEQVVLLANIASPTASATKEMRLSC